MASMAASARPVIGLALALSIMAVVPSVRAEIRQMEVRSDSRSIIPLDDFGFTRRGGLELNVSGISFSSSADIALSQLGFFLCTPEAWLRVLRQIRDLDITCALQSGDPDVHVVYELDRLALDPPPNPSGASASVARSTSFVVAENLTDQPGQFTLLFANCLPNLRVSMSVRSAMFNFPEPSRRAFLSAGAAPLPFIYSLLFFAYAALAIAWAAVLFRRRTAVFRIHYFMLAVIVLKALNLLCEAEDKSYIERTGSAHGWDVLFYIFSFLKGISLFTLIVLIGTGWSFLKPYLQDREKRVLMAIIPLQVVANIAQVAIDESGRYSSDWVTWKQVFLLVDVVCCCAVLFPIVWSIKNLREAARTNGKAAVNLMKLTLFRQYYIVVICYIYFTRVGVYALSNFISYRYLWTSVVAGELATLAFYVFTGYKFRPAAHNPYLTIDDDEEEESAAEALKLDDGSFEL